MAGTLTVTALLQDQVTGGASESLGWSQQQFSQVGTNINKGTMAVTNSAAVVPIGSIGSLGYGIFKNLDPVNTVSLRVGSGGSNFATMGPGQMCLVAQPGNLYAVSNATAQMEFMYAEL